jgi:hypothetical protein
MACVHHKIGLKAEISIKDGNKNMLISFSEDGGKTF